MISKSNKYIKRNLQIIKNSQTKCLKDKWFRSSLVFDTISLKQISLLTQSVVLWDLPTSAFQDKMIYSTEKKHTRSVLCELLYVSFSLFDSKCTKNIFSLEEFFFFFLNLFHKWGTMHIYVTEQTHYFKNNCCIQTYWLKK